MADWNIQSRAHACQGCHRDFHEGEALHTLLFETRGAYHRLDVCETCWQAEHAQGSNHRRGFISHWQGRYDPPPAAPPEPIQKESAESLLRKLIEGRDPQHAGAVFILAVMLERKRLLKAKAQATESGQRLLIYEHAGTGDMFTVPDPGLRLDQLAEVQRDVAALLEHGLPAPVPAPDPQAESAPPPHAVADPETGNPTEDPLPACPPAVAHS